jgi:hypothetical protein
MWVKGEVKNTKGARNNKENKFVIVTESSSQLLTNHPKTSNPKKCSHKAATPISKACLNMLTAIIPLYQIIIELFGY